MALMRNKRAMGWMAAVALCVQVAHAEEPDLDGYVAPNFTPCMNTVESGMSIFNASGFGYQGSGFATELYSNALERDPGPDGRMDRLPTSIPELSGFDGYRVMDCRTGKFLAFRGMTPSERNQVGSNGQAEQLLATEFLRDKHQNKQPFALSDVKRAAQALYKGREVQILELRETEQTCACKEYGGQ